MLEQKQINTRILVVDDEPIILRTLAEGLTKFGYEIVTSQSSADALRLYAENPPDLVILDYRMPQENGVEIAKKMLAQAHRPIIMLSAYSDLLMVREAIDVGIASYLVKPVEAARMVPSIEAALARFHETAALLKQGDNIQAVIETQRLLSTAVGIVMAQNRLAKDVAFECLRKMARDQRRPLRDLALDLVDATTTTNAILTQLAKLAEKLSNR